MCRKIWTGISPSLPIPKLTQYIQFVKSGKKIGQGPPPPHLDKIQENSYFFRDNRPLSSKENLKIRSCLEPEFEIDEDNCRRVDAKTEAELIELLRVGDVACQAQAAWRRAPEEELNILFLFARPPFASE